MSEPNIQAELEHAREIYKIILEDWQERHNTKVVPLTFEEWLDEENK